MSKLDGTSTIGKITTKAVDKIDKPYNLTMIVFMGIFNLAGLSIYFASNENNKSVLAIVLIACDFTFIILSVVLLFILQMRKSAISDESNRYNRNLPQTTDAQ